MKRDLKSVHTDLEIGPAWPIFNTITKICLFKDKKLFFLLIFEFGELAKWDLISDTYPATYGPFSWNVSLSIISDKSEGAGEA